MIRLPFFHSVLSKVKKAAGCWLKGLSPSPLPENTVKWLRFSVFFHCKLIHLLAFTPLPLLTVSRFHSSPFGRAVSLLIAIPSKTR